ncbi:MAG: ABC transporter permease [Bacteroidales bacterium]
MKTIACFIKTLRENLRDWKILILAIVFAPFFVYLMYLYMGDTGSASYNVIMINADRTGNFAADLAAELGKIKTEDGKTVINILGGIDSVTARDRVKNKDADLVITIPPGFTRALDEYVAGRNAYLPAIRSFGDQANTRYMIAASFTDYTIYNYLGTVTKVTSPVNISYEYAGRGKALNEFDLYVPALLVLSLIMMLFTAGASIVREIEKDTITRLSLSRLSSSEFMTALSLNQVLIGLLCLFLTLLAAFSVGYTTSGSIPLLLLTGTLTCFSVIAIGIITSCFIKTMFGLLTLGCFPFFILMFFSDCFLPLPKVLLFGLAGHNVYLNDLLPTATATRAFNKILNYNSGIKDIYFELSWIAGVSLVYFAAGVRKFRAKYRY